MIGATFIGDGIWGAAQGVASNGFLMKVTPRENRTMYVAAMAGLSGIAGGIGAYAAGHLSSAITSFSWHFAGHHWNNYHVVFAVGLLLRVLTLPLGYRIHEPRSSAPGQVLPNLAEMWPMTWLLMPIRLYRRTFSNNNHTP